MDRELLKTLGDGFAWSVILFPLGLAALVWGLPHLLDLLGGLFHLMREFAHAVR